MIWFNSKKARQQLRNEGIVITCRKRRKGFGSHKIYFTNDEGNKEILGLAEVEYLKESYDSQREHDKIFSDYIHLSGFKTVNEWKKEVRTLNNNRWMPDYLIFIKVTMIELYDEVLE